MALGLGCLLVGRFTGAVHNLLFHFKNYVFYDILKVNGIYLGKVILLDPIETSTEERTEPSMSRGTERGNTQWKNIDGQ